MQLKTFISYSSTDKLVASKVKEYLAEYNIVSFLAHEDIHISQEWRERIIEELNQIEIFIPLLSTAFKQSEWASQEIGFAFSRNSVLIVPISIDGTIPYGFIAALQGKRIPSNNDYYSMLIEPIIQKFPHAVFPKLIERLSRAGSFRNAEALMKPLLSHFASFNDEEIESFVDTCMGNGQIWDAGECKIKYIPLFIEMHRTRIPARKLKQLTRLIKR